MNIPESSCIAAAFSGFTFPNIGKEFLAAIAGDIAQKMLLLVPNMSTSF